MKKGSVAAEAAGKRRAQEVFEADQLVTAATDIQEADKSERGHEAAKNPLRPHRDDILPAQPFQQQNHGKKREKRDVNTDAVITPDLVQTQNIQHGSNPTGQAEQDRRHIE